MVSGGVHCVMLCYSRVLVRVPMVSGELHCVMLCYSIVEYWLESQWYQVGYKSAPVSHAKLAPGWMLIQVNFDPVQEI